MNGSDRLDHLLDARATDLQAGHNWLDSMLDEPRQLGCERTFGTSRAEARDYEQHSGHGHIFCQPAPIPPIHGLTCAVSSCLNLGFVMTKAPLLVLLCLSGGYGVQCGCRV